MSKKVNNNEEVSNLIKKISQEADEYYKKGLEFSKEEDKTNCINKFKKMLNKHKENNEIFKKLANNEIIDIEGENNEQD